MPLFKLKTALFQPGNRPCQKQIYDMNDNSVYACYSSAPTARKDFKTFIYFKMHISLPFPTAANAPAPHPTTNPNKLGSFQEKESKFDKKWQFHFKEGTNVEMQHNEEKSSPENRLCSPRREIGTKGLSVPVSEVKVRYTLKLLRIRQEKLYPMQGGRNEVTEEALCDRRSSTTPKPKSVALTMDRDLE